MALIDLKIYRNIDLKLFTKVTPTIPTIESNNNNPFTLYTIKLDKPFKKPNNIRDEEFNKILNKDLIRVLKCLSHGINFYNILSINNHFKKFHADIYNNIDKDELTILYNRFINDKFNLTPSFILNIPNIIPWNKVYFKDLPLEYGFKCIKCDYISLSSKKVRVHLNNEHLLFFKPLGNQPKVYSDDYIIYNIPISILLLNNRALFIPKLPKIDRRNTDSDLDYLSEYSNTNSNISSKDIEG